MTEGDSCAEAVRWALGRSERRKFCGLQDGAAYRILSLSVGVARGIMATFRFHFYCLGVGRAAGQRYAGCSCTWLDSVVGLALNAVVSRHTERFWQDCKEAQVPVFQASRWNKGRTRLWVSEWCGWVVLPPAKNRNCLLRCVGRTLWRHTSRGFRWIAKLSTGRSGQEELSTEQGQCR